MLKKHFNKATLSIVVIIIFTICFLSVSALNGLWKTEYWDQYVLLSPTQVTTPNGTVVPAWTFESDFQDPAKEASKAAQQARYA